MKVSLNWVKEFTDVKLPVDELVNKIGAQLGAVEEVVDLSKKYQGIVVAKVVTCEKHPNADKLHVCTIDDGSITPDVKRDNKGHVQVVCGAPNVREGLLVTWLPPGSTVPTTYDKDPFVLEARELRGVISNGMLASASELALSDDHAGILEINPHDAEPGDDFAKAYKLDDYIIDIENKMFTHRPDLFGILGVAREIAGITGQKFVSPKWYLGASSSVVNSKDKDLLRVQNELPELVPRFMAQIVKGVKVAPSPTGLQTYLSRVGIRPINNIVDVTNYMMVLTGQPMHAYDHDKLAARSKDKKPTIVIRHPKNGEKIKLLSGKVIEPRKEAIMIATDKELIGIGGVMGGADTEVDENTKNIVLECANFDMYSIRRTAMEHGLFTDAVTRFTKGQSPLQNDKVMSAAIGDIISYSDGVAGSSIYDVRGAIRKPVAVHVTDEFINARLGLKLGIREMARLLENVEFEVAINGPTLVVTPPFWRTDIEIPEDVVEEIGRLYGYDRLLLELPKRDLTPPKKDEMLELKKQSRTILAASGANELLTYSFIHGNLMDKVGQDRNLAYELANALSPDLQYYRQALTPSLLEKVHPNIKAGHSEFAIFELGKSHVKGLKVDGLPKELERLAVVFSADSKSSHKPTGAPYYQAQTYLLHLLQNLGLENEVAFRPINAPDKGAQPYYQPGRSAIITVGQNTILGWTGEYKPSVVSALKLPTFTAGFELDLEILLAHTQTAEQSVQLSRFPKVEQDICLKVASDLNYSQLYGFINETVQNLKPTDTRASLTPIDIYQREDDKTYKQITYRLSIVADDRTLTDQAVNDLLDDVAKAVHKKFHGERI